MAAYLCSFVQCRRQQTSALGLFQLAEQLVQPRYGVDVGARLLGLVGRFLRTQALEVHEARDPRRAGAMGACQAVDEGVAPCIQGVGHEIEKWGEEARHVLVLPLANDLPPEGDGKMEHLYRELIQHGVVRLIGIQAGHYASDVELRQGGT